MIIDYLSVTPILMFQAISSAGETEVKQLEGKTQRTYSKGANEVAQ